MVVFIAWCGDLLLSFFLKKNAQLRSWWLIMPAHMKTHMWSKLSQNMMVGSMMTRTNKFIKDEDASVQKQHPQEGDELDSSHRASGLQCGPSHCPMTRGRVSSLTRTQGKNKECHHVMKAPGGYDPYIKTVALQLLQSSCSISFPCLLLSCETSKIIQHTAAWNTTQYAG